jgi:hypothetical protein
MTAYQMQRARRGEDLHIGGRFKAGLLAPVMAHKLKGSESAILSQRAHFQLDPIPGRLMSPIRGQVVAVYVPLQALHALKNPTADYPGSNDVIRAALANKEQLFQLEEESDISRRLGLVPKSVAGTKMVCESGRLAYLAAVNFLRQRRYVLATTVAKTETAILPAILSQTVLDRLNGVLDPEDRVNGAVDINAMLRVKGIGAANSATTATSGGAGRWQEDDDPTDKEIYTSAADNLYITADGVDGVPELYAELGTNVSLTDMYRAEKMDALMRRMRKFVDDNPEHGEEIVARWAMGLSLDIGRQPFVLYEKEITLMGDVQRPSDFANMDETRTYAANSIGFTVPVPATEFGGVVVTMMVVKPDEVLDSQPNPMFTEAWEQDNYVADEMAVDPVPVTIRELYADCDVGDEDTVALYVGNHGLKRYYKHYGWNRAVDPLDVEGETSIWQLEVPMSVTPENVNYPNPLPQTPFADTTAEVCLYGLQSAITVQTPLIFGPSPIEELAAIEDQDVFEDEPAT